MAVQETLTPRQRILIGIFAAAMAGIGFLGGRILLRPARSIAQPVEFNHSLHAEAGLGCLDCHNYYETGRHSGLPSVDICMGCHEGGVTESPEEEKLLALAEAGVMDPFRKLFQLPDHVDYSHRTHVVLAGLECDVCHGAIAETTAPPPTPLVRVTMDMCVNCHAESGARTDCTPCHH